MTAPTASEEQTIWKGNSSHALYLGTYALCGGSCLVAVAVGLALWELVGVRGTYVLAGLIAWAAVALFFALWKFIQLHSREYEVTTERIRVRTGLLSRRTEELELYRVKDNVLLEPFKQRLFHVGSIQLTTHDASSPMLLLEAVPNASGLRDEIRKHVELCRERKRVRLAELE